MHCDSPPPPIKLVHHAGTDAGALALVNVAVYVEPRMHDRYVRREKAHMHFRRLAGTRSEWSIGAMQAPHQVTEAVASLGSCAVDSNELAYPVLIGAASAIIRRAFDGERLEAVDQVGELGIRERLNVESRDRWRLTANQP